MSLLYRYTALNILHGVGRKGPIDEIWDISSPFFSSKIAEIISKYQYWKVNAILLIVPEIEQDSNDKISKIRPMVEELNFKFKKHFQPGYFLSLDEGLAIKQALLTKKYL